MIAAATLPLHLDILPADARKLFGRLKRFVPRGVLGGGSAIALQIGHRVSYDLDVFINTYVPRGLLRRAQELFGSAKPLIDSREELTCAVDGTKLTVLSYPYRPLHPAVTTTSIPLFDLRDLASSKTYTIGRRGAWRDYVDLFVLLRSGLKLRRIIAETQKRFGPSFSPKLFLQQLTFYEDIHDVSIEWRGVKFSRRIIQSFLQRQVRQYLREVRAG